MPWDSARGPAATGQPWSRPTPQATGRTSGLTWSPHLFVRGDSRMSCRVVRVAAPALLIAIIAVAQPVHAQSRIAYQAGSTPPAQPTPQAAEQLPPGHMQGGMPSAGPYMGGYSDNGYEYGTAGCYDGSFCPHGYYDDGCCDMCGSYDCDGSCWYRGGWGCDLFGWCCPPGRYYFTADYIYARANFSSAIAFLEQEDEIEQGVGIDTFHSLSFNYESSYRFGGGYRLCNCGEEVRFLFTRLSSTANSVAPFGAFNAYEVTAEPDGETRIHAGVDVKSYDVDFAKTIQLGGQCCGCGDSCGGYGCGDPCGCGCPAWDITWSGGFRFADVGWSRTYDAVNADFETTTNAVSVMDFRGGGLKMGLEGRRYFCGNGCFSVYLKGDLSLLFGDVDLQAVRRTFDDGEQETLNIQTFGTRQIIPVTEIETGLTAHVTCNTSFTTGYMFSAWHDLGFRDEFNFPTLMETSYDDANILGFEGFFARFELAY
jgi:hypothetical protein